ncbi:MAG TPA: hypothetical protein VK325_07510 [Pseudoxanthomonas sp.]|nr:hypothetical protein [Pseudoxanthomonas sp.]
MKNYSLWLASGLMLGLSACYFPTSFGKRTMVEHTVNPQPKQAYQITMTLADAPGPFAFMLGLVQYDVVNQECLSPPKDNPGGAPMHLTRHIEFELIRVSDVEYTGTVYADGLLDEDYYGRGICRWQLTQARVHLKATGAPRETLFNASISAEPLLAEKTEKIYFLKEAYPGYPDSIAENPLHSGQRDQTKIPPQFSEKDLFTITVASKRRSP